MTASPSGLVAPGQRMLTRGAVAREFKFIAVDVVSLHGAGVVHRRAMERPPPAFAVLVDYLAGGMITVSMTWMTPFDAATSAVTTVALLIMTLPPLPLILIGSPLTACAVVNLPTAAELTLP